MNLHKYTFVNVCKEYKDLELGDDAVKIFLTPDSTADDISGELYVGESHKYKQLNLKTTESQTVRIPYYGDTYSMTSAGNSVSVYNSDPSHVSVALTGINMSSAGSYITYRITGRSEGNSIVKFTDAYSGELLDAYNVNVGPAVRETVKACKDVTNPKSYSYKAIMWAQEKGIAKGSDGLFRPATKCKRRDIVTFIYRYKN